MIGLLKGCVLSNRMKIALTIQVFPASWGLRFPKSSNAEIIVWICVDCHARCIWGCVGDTVTLSESQESEKQQHNAITCYV